MPHSAPIGFQHPRHSPAGKAGIDFQVLPTNAEAQNPQDPFPHLVIVGSESLWPPGCSGPSNRRNRSRECEWPAIRQSTSRRATAFLDDSIWFLVCCTPKDTDNWTQGRKKVRRRAHSMFYGMPPLASSHLIGGQAEQSQFGGALKDLVSGEMATSRLSRIDLYGLS